MSHTPVFPRLLGPPSLVIRQRAMLAGHHQDLPSVVKHPLGAFDEAKDDHESFAVSGAFLSAAVAEVL
jgi:hypothetical protein